MSDALFISVLMPVYNGSKHIREAIDSILNQTHANFELIIIDDCSKDDTVEIVKSYTDKRIVLIQNEVNLRTASSLNKTIEIAKGKYLARMDQDDISYPERFAKQIAFLEANPDYGICGTQLRNFGEHVNGEIDTNTPLLHEELQLRNLYYVAFDHTSVMMRRSVLMDNNLRYRAGVIAEDYSLWKQLLLVTKGATIDEVLMKRRVHGSSTTSTLFRTLVKDMVIMRKEYVKDLLPGYSNIWYDLFSSSSQSLRKLAIRYFSRKQTKFKAQLFEKYMNKYNEYFLYRTGWRWALGRVKEKIKKF